jgi:hypothetical protein
MYRLSDLSFIAYLVHPLVKEFFWRGLFGKPVTSLNLHFIFAIPLLASVVFMLSMGIAGLLRIFPRSRLLFG